MSLANFVLFAWFPIVLILFRFLPSHRAVIASMVAGLLLLPMMELTKMKGSNAPDPIVFIALKLTKTNVIAASCLLGVLLFDPRRLLTFRPRWFDLPLACYFVFSFISGIRNPSLSLYDSVGATRDEVLIWGVPYFLGRIYMGNEARLRDLTLGVVIGGLAYVLPSMYEWKFSPVLHARVYGFITFDPNDSIRGFSFRPVVFMQHGLAWAMWMAGAALLATWLWWSGALPRFRIGRGRFIVPMLGAALVLEAVVVLGRSLGATMLGIAGMTALFLTRWLRFPVLLVALMAFPPVYVITRSNGIWDGHMSSIIGISTIMGWFSDAEREKSQNYRLKNEELMFKYKTPDHPWFGEGGWDFLKIPKQKDTNEDRIIPDGLWVLLVIGNGYLGLTALFTMFLLPAVRLLCLYPQRLWSRPHFGPAVAGAVLLVLCEIDYLFNAMVNPVFMLLAGGLLSWTPTTAPAPEAREAAAARPLMPMGRRPVNRPSGPSRPGVLGRPKPFAR